MSASDQIQKLIDKAARLQAQEIAREQRKAATDAEKKRKLENRKKTIAGAVLLKLVASDSAVKSTFTNRILPAMSDADRSLFVLPEQQQDVGAAA